MAPPFAETCPDSKKISGGSFKGMSLVSSVLKGILHRGFKQPTPIQRKVIPVLLGGKDVIGMARTGAGKTAAFVIPILQKLKRHSAKIGARALILSPNRELAIQTRDFIDSIGKYTDLRTAVILGGESLEMQFSAMANNPDILIATPGRLLHLCVEAEASLKSVEIVVYDEADRLFEMGFADPINQLIDRLPDTKQSAFFSATMPKNLAEFANAKLSNPAFISLENEHTLSEDLQTSFLFVRPDYKTALLISLLRSIFSNAAAGRKDEPSVLIFVATKHHVEYLQELLKCDGFRVAYIYGSLDQDARVEALRLFSTRAIPILVVTDVAARGLDIPLIDVVINYDFPATPKLFVHRVGRVARNGSAGIAYSMLTAGEIPYLVDLKLELSHNSGHAFALAEVCQEALDQEQENIKKLTSTHSSLEALKGVTVNAHKLYVKTRPAASRQSFVQAKTLPIVRGASFLSDQTNDEIELKSAISSYKPKQIQGSEGARIPLFPKGTATTRSSENTRSFKDRSFFLDFKTSSKKKHMPDLTSDSLQRSANPKKTKPESIKPSYKTGAYEKWKRKTHLNIPRHGEDELDQTRLLPLLKAKKRWCKAKARAQ